MLKRFEATRLKRYVVTQFYNAKNKLSMTLFLLFENTYRVCCIRQRWKFAFVTSDVVTDVSQIIQSHIPSNRQWTHESVFPRFSCFKS